MAKRYAPTTVKRYYADYRRRNELIAEYTDATVRDQGEDAVWHAPQAMLRAYSHDPAFYNDSRGDRGYRAKSGYVRDDDDDIALKRVIGTVVGRTSFGHCDEEWVVLVEGDDDGEWTGFGLRGQDVPVYRVERWRVELHDSSNEGR